MFFDGCFKKKRGWVLGPREHNSPSRDRYRKGFGLRLVTGGRFGLIIYNTGGKWFAWVVDVYGSRMLWWSCRDLCMFSYAWGVALMLSGWASPYSSFCAECRVPFFFFFSNFSLSKACSTHVVLVVAGLCFMRRFDTRPFFPWFLFLVCLESCFQRGNFLTTRVLSPILFYFILFLQGHLVPICLLNIPLPKKKKKKGKKKWVCLLILFSSQIFISPQEGFTEPHRSNLLKNSHSSKLAR
ncbi:hypothetical protein CPSG_06729 [Coccidioides posadasii str. Silveira]|uniref:Uncharacterized protein n=1 Tax=Coccidioides posadasii (strain RMSCC 757 / Silveira) TaxID=443226 RepID=E9DA39_COCPS|nr:hypothetical protein CPSG_06729 [Coccidioides posadasii str. Silveira]